MFRIAWTTDKGTLQTSDTFPVGFHTSLLSTSSLAAKWLFPQLFADGSSFVQEK